MVAYFLAELQKIAPLTELMRGTIRGIEREALRVTPEGRLAQTPHPKAFGSKLTNPEITTDFSENLIELITPPCDSVDALMKSLSRIHDEVRRNLSHEYLWPLSMPCYIGSDDEIPIADYGPSASGQIKMAYRRGLGHRYGKRMQTIAGLHYNFSLPISFWEQLYALSNPPGPSLRDFINEGYLQAARNHMENAWILAYLFGASPAFDHSLMPDPLFLRHEPALTRWGDSTWLAPYGTSLRSTPCGYSTAVQSAHVHIRFDQFKHYVTDLERATHTPYPPYDAITQAFGPEAQLNNHLLQMPAEFYHSIRLKRNVHDSLDLLESLRTQGAEYIELRSLDLNPYSPYGITQDQVLFLDIYLLFCILQRNAPNVSKEWRQNLHGTGFEGRNPQFKIMTQSQAEPLIAPLNRLFEIFFEIASYLDGAPVDGPYWQALSKICLSATEPHNLPSAIIISDIKQEDSFNSWGLRQAKRLSLSC